MKQINLNAEVTIELTDLGEKILHEEFNEITKNSQILKNTDFEDVYKIKNGKIAMPLWRVMNTFGLYMNQGAPNYPIKNLMIYINDSDIKEA